MLRANHGRVSIYCPFVVMLYRGKYRGRLQGNVWKTCPSGIKPSKRRLVGNIVRYSQYRCLPVAMVNGGVRKSSFDERPASFDASSADVGSCFRIRDACDRRGTWVHVVVGAG